MTKVRKTDKDLLIKCLQGTAEPYEQEMAWEWIHESEANKAYYEKLKTAWISKKVGEPVDAAQMKRSWENISKKIEKSRSLKKAGGAGTFHSTFYVTMAWNRLAAAVILAFMIGGIGTVVFLSMLNSAKTIGESFTIEAPRGAKSVVSMADGSRIWLNAGSKITYSEAYNKKNRDIFLEGEGYFEVAKNENINFRVYAADIVVSALGTSFNVRAYPEDGVVETTLVEGSVSIRRASASDQSEGIILEPNQRASFYTDRFTVNRANREENLVSNGEASPKPMRVRLQSNINTEISTSWKNKKWVFEREKLGSLAQKLERQYDINIIFEDDEIKDFVLTGTLEEESVEQVLAALQLTLPITFSIQHSDVHLRIDKRKIDAYRQLLRTQ